MQLRNAVDLMAAGQAEVRHAHLVVGDDGHIVPLAGVVRVDALQLFHETAVDLLADRVDPRQLLLEQADRPALERFGHDGMVGVGERPTRGPSRSRARRREAASAPARTGPDGCR